MPSWYNRSSAVLPLPVYFVFASFLCLISAAMYVTHIANVVLPYARGGVKDLVHYQSTTKLDWREYLQFCFDLLITIVPASLRPWGMRSILVSVGSALVASVTADKASIVSAEE